MLAVDWATVAQLAAAIATAIAAIFAWMAASASRDQVEDQRLAARRAELFQIDQIVARIEGRLTSSNAKGVKDPSAVLAAFERERQELRQHLALVGGGKLSSTHDLSTPYEGSTSEDLLFKAQMARAELEAELTLTTFSKRQERRLREVYRHPFTR